jgi:integrase
MSERRRTRRAFGALRKRSNGRYQASYLDPQGIRRVAPRTFTTKADANAWLSARESELHQGVWRDPAIGRITLSEYGSRWIAEHKLASRTRDLYRGLFRGHVEPFLGKQALEDLKPETIRWWRARLRDDGRSESTTAKAYRLLRAIMNAAVDDGRISRNPCRIKGADQERPHERPVATVPQVLALAEAVGPRYRTFVLTAALCSLRWGELVALRRRDVDLRSGIVQINRSLSENGGHLEYTLPKNSKTRVVVLPQLLIDELSSHLARVPGDPEALIFTGERGGVLRRGNWRAIVKWPAAVDTAGLPKGFHFHDLRHTGNHLAAQTGASTRELMQRMGHSTVRAALIYQHATEARSKHLAERLDALVRQQSEDES